MRSLKTVRGESRYADCADSDRRVVIGMSFTRSAVYFSKFRREAVRLRNVVAALIALSLLLSPTVFSQQTAHAIKINESIYQAEGNGNTYLVTTPDGNVVIDTSTFSQAPQHKKLLNSVNARPVKYIILTHGHEDHRGGVQIWKEEQTQVIAQKNYAEFYSYQCRLAPFFSRRMAAQFRGKMDSTVPAGLYDHPLDANIFVTTNGMTLSLEA